MDSHPGSPTKNAIDWNLVREHFLNSNAGLGFKGEAFVEDWLHENGHEYLKAGDLLWDDSDEYLQAKREYAERISLGPEDVLYWREYSEFLDGFGKRRKEFKTEASYRRHLRERRTAYNDYRKGRIYKDLVERYHGAIQATHRFFEGKGGEEERAKTFMRDMRQLQRQLNTERMRYVKKTAQARWDHHTAMMPDFLARMPNRHLA